MSAVSSGVTTSSSSPAGGFTFEPRTVVSNPKQFGKSSANLEPSDGISASDPRFGAAQLQHRVANRVREGLLSQGSNLFEFSERSNLSPGMKYDRLVRIQRGETLMQLADLIKWSESFEGVRELLAREQFGFRSDHVEV
jgi:hypothetical protein